MHLVIVIAIAAGLYLGSLYLWPFKPCGFCKGTGTSRGSTRKRFGDCRFCHGTRRRQRAGSKQLHRAVRALVSARRNRKDN